ncbi:uncharacterized protein EI90DRAFT_3133967 [Cantharellus anzutake]|uniref:uncharacterized protein n=1 Tax=Cantharellus anzutake TaxID=1750568 RepID=UPI0019077EEC|nr:uncharacterized protein EI90DRAFT_3133967 [Cantharellus anzutake]KAF8317231.1 hypothetical protein EI90DRAFT_3133967 [Cantharellus anzutake]
MGTGSSLTTDKPSTKTSSWTEVSDSIDDNDAAALEELRWSLTDSSLQVPVERRRSAETKAEVVSTPDSFISRAPLSLSLPVLSPPGIHTRRRAGHASIATASTTSTDISMLLQSISNRSSTQLSDADVRAISTLWLSDALSADDLSHILRSQFHISEEFVRCLIHVHQAWMEDGH